MDDIVFIRDWVKDRMLGSGSFGTVVLWRHQRTDERLAIKTCKWGDELNARQRERWTKEVEMLQSCDNPNIVGTRELPPGFLEGLEPANPSKLPILCMEYCSGGDLRKLLNKPESCTGLNEIQVKQILKDIGNAVQFLHLNKITHRDLKPENIVMHVVDSPGSNIGTQNQTKVTYKLIDLGYAKEIDSNSVCASFVGTLQYLAPELLYSKTYSNSVDFWSFGLLAFEIICGVRPFLPHMSPVQWMPHVKKKAHENICVYETFHEVVEYSNEIFAENHISKAFKSLIEQWLRVALEWDPKLRGRDAPSKVTFNIPSETEQIESSSQVVFFSLLQRILLTKIIKVFSVTTLTALSYPIDNSTNILTLKTWISKDTKIPIHEQILISQTTYVDIANDEVVIKYWNENLNNMIYLYEKTNIIDDNAKPVVPKAVQRCLENQNTKYNFKNSQTLYRHGLHFVMSQMEVYEGLINGLLTRAESLKHESRQLLLKHNTVDKDIGKLVSQEETILKMIEVGKKHVQILRENGTATNYLGGFQKIFDDADELFDKINKLQSAWSTLTVRLQSASRRSNEVVAVDLNGFILKNNYQAIFTNAVTAYINFKRSEFQSDSRTKQKQCPDITKICYNGLKFRCNVLSEMKEQPFILKLQDLNTEFAKISEIIATAADNTEKLKSDLSTVIEELSNCMWSTVSILASDADNLADLPYSVISFQKRDFKVGEPVSKHCINVTNKVGDDERLKSLIEESLRVRQSQKSLSEKLNLQKKIIINSNLDFSFLDSNNE